MTQASNYGQSLERSRLWIEAAQKMKNYTTQPSMKERYETLRERYASGSMSLEDFTAEVVTLLREGL